MCRAAGVLCCGAAGVLCCGAVVRGARGARGGAACEAVVRYVWGGDRAAHRECLFCAVGRSDSLLMWGERTP